MLSFNNLASVFGHGGVLLGVPGPLGTFISPVSFLTTVGTLVLPGLVNLSRLRPF
jgi:hypothetical protein